MIPETPTNDPRLDAAVIESQRNALWCADQWAALRNNPVMLRVTAGGPVLVAELVRLMLLEIGTGEQEAARIAFDIGDIDYNARAIDRVGARLRVVDRPVDRDADIALIRADVDRLTVRIDQFDREIRKPKTVEAKGV